MEDAPPTVPGQAVEQGPEAGEEVATIDLPKNHADLVELLRYQRLRILQMAAQKTKSRLLNETEIAKLHTFFRTLNNIQMTPALKKDTKLDIAMTVTMDKVRYKFPPPFPEMAKKLEDLWVAQNWGAGEVNEEVVSDEEDEAGAASNVNQTEPSDVGRRIHDERTKIIRRPHPNHPIYGTNGIMHGILVVKGKTTAYQLDDNFTRRNASVFGHNGLEVGTSWPLQIAALRDGAHGSRMGGIAGKADHGAFSVVVSGMYSELDQDRGDVLFYSGSNSHQNADRHNPVISAATRCLHQSISTGKPVRVIRTSSSHYQHAPIAGLRYDGLYTVVSSATAYNGNGGAYIQFKLQRQDGQAPIATNRPTRREADEFAKVRLHY